MKTHTGGIIAFLNRNTQEQISKPADCFNKEAITMIDVHDLVRNERNFYGIRDVEELASMIAASGVVEPLHVTPIGDGKYRIISGERRASATLLRLQRGDLIDPKLPCIVVVFNDSDLLDAKEQEMLLLIASNRGQRQKRTALEQLREVEELEPIAKKISKAESIQGSFRSFFAKEILNISPSHLQRLKTLTHLIPEAQEALKMEILSDTAAMELATYSEDEQLAYINAVFDDNIKTRVKDIKEFFSESLEDNIDPTENEDFDDEDFDDESETLETAFPSNDAGEDAGLSAPAPAASVNNNEESAHEEDSEPDEEEIPKETDNSVSLDSAKKEHEKQKSVSTVRNPRSATINLDVPIPKDMNRDQMEHEADTWIEAILTDSIRIAEEKTNEAREVGEMKLAALWDSRRAKAVLVLETVRE